VAKTRAAPPPAPTPDRVARLARAGDRPAAVELARRLYAQAPTAENLALLRRTVIDAAGHFADRDREADFARVMAAADVLDPADRACLLARGGRLPEALMVADDAARPRALGHAADRAVRVRSKELLPDDLHPGFDAVMAAFRHHEAGDADAARAALEPIGLRSPFLEWKVLLRGLLAHAAGDDARAAEAFARLDPARLPARLAAPLRAALDPAFKGSHPDGPALLDRYAQLTRSPVADKLRAIAKELGRDKPLGPAFKAAEAALPHLKRVAPDLVPRLAAAFYQALAGQGEPNDLPRFRKLFGEPPDDPQFHKLLALIAEQVGDPAGVHAHWLRYDAWLATSPPGWPADLLARARAEVWDRLGENARRAADRPDESDPLLGFFAPPRRRKPKPPDPPAEECFRRAAALAPDWPDPGRKLFDALAAAGRAGDAEAAARAVLARRPDDLPTLVALAGMLQRQGRAADAAELWLKALAVHPLDHAIRFRAATAVLAEARRQAAGAKKAADAATALLDRHRVLLEEQTPAALHALRSVLLTKLGKADDAAADRAKALAVPGGRVGAAYRVMADSILLKLKPADKRAADALFAEELAKPPTPWEVNQLVAAYDAYHVDGVSFRGQKGHDKKVLDQVARCSDAAAPPEEFERLLNVLLLKREWRHAKKLADACIVRFPDDPTFHVARAEAGLGLGERAYYVENRLRRAKGQAERSADPRHRAVLGRIDRLLNEVAPPFDLFEAFFGR
jgi:tetratricopeptide (TPR) repeat protein